MTTQLPEPALLSAPLVPGSVLVAALDAGAAELRAEGVAARTRRGCAADLWRYGAWCAERGLAPHPGFGREPRQARRPSPGEGKAPSTIERALAAVLSAHRLARVAWPDTKAARTAPQTVDLQLAKIAGGRRARRQ